MSQAVARRPALRVPAAIPRWIARHLWLSAGLLVWGLAILAACFPALFTSTDPNAQELTERLLAPLQSADHPLGTDNLGRDVFARLIHGTRTSVVVSLLGVGLSVLAGTVFGLIGGYFRRGAGAAVAGLIDVQMAFPGMVLALVLAVMLRQSGIVVVAIVIGVGGWAGYARVLRGQVLSLREREFVTAARASGSKPLRVLRIHLLPNVAGTVGVLAVIDLSRAILTEASLSYLGFGISPPGVSWGLMLAEGQSFIYTAWWLVTLPGIAIALLVLSANVIAGALQNRIDPELRTPGHV